MIFISQRDFVQQLYMKFAGYAPSLKVSRVVWDLADVLNESILKTSVMVVLKYKFIPLK